MLCITIMRNVQIEIESVAFKGYGVARVQGKVVFVPYTATGDKARIEVVDEKKEYSIGRVVEIIEPSPWRVVPPCPYFGRCGGCQWQHIDYSTQGELKKEILHDLLQRLGRLKEIPSIRIMRSPKPYDYRIRIQLKAKGKAIGYYQERTHRIVEIDRCPISHPLVNQIIRELKEESSALEPMEEIEINVSPEEGRGVILFHPHSRDRWTKHFMKDFLQSHPVLRGIALSRKGGFHLFGDPALNLTIHLSQEVEKRSLKLRISPGSFSQVHPEQNEALIQTVLQFSGVNKEDRILDLYAGVGNLTLPLAIGARGVLGIEENRTAIEDARFNAERNGVNHCDFIHGKAEQASAIWKKEPPDLIVLDPPRTGCKTILDQLVRWKPRKIIYVSCEPTTFSRDLHLFSERGYSLQSLVLIDMFPQTYHMELVGLLQPN
jgi:23S rRNA (uracil1939-C5)-methyltransferase